MNWGVHEEYIKTPEQAWTRAERIWAGETAKMPLRACMGKHRVQELLVCDAINLIYELWALIWRTDWQHCEGLPTFLRQCERQLTCLDCDFLSLSPAFFFFVPRIDMMEEAGTWNWSQGSNSIVFRRPRKLHFLHILKEFPHLPAARSHGSSYGLQWQWKDGVCCCVNRGNDPLTLCVCVHRWLYCPIWMFTV